MPARICAHLELLDETTGEANIAAFMDALERLMMAHGVLSVQAKPHGILHEQTQVWH